MRVIEEHFDSIHQLLNVLNGRKNNSEMISCHSSNNNGKSFTGTVTYTEAV